MLSAFQKEEIRKQKRSCSEMRTLRAPAFTVLEGRRLGKDSILLCQYLAGWAVKLG